MAPIIFRNRSFAALWLAQAISQAGGRLLQIAVLWSILSSTTAGGGRALAVFMVLSALPPIAFATRIGRAIDAVGARYLLMRAPLVGAGLAALMWGLFSAGHGGLIWLYAAAFCFATVLAIVEPSVMKALPSVVEPSDTVAGVAFLTSTQTLAYFAGALLGAVLVDKVGLAGAYGVAAAAYLATAGLNALARPRSDPAAAAAKSAKDADGLTAWQLIRGLPVIRQVLIGFAAINFFSIPVMVLLPIYTKTVLSGSAMRLALYEGALWSGLLAGSILARYLPKSWHALNVTAAALLAFGLALLAPGVVVGPVAYAVFLGGTGLALGTINVRMLSYFQTAVPEAQKGRFFAVMRATVSGAAPVGFFTFGSLADVVSVPSLCLIQGGAVLLISPYFFRLARAARGTLPEITP